MHSRCSDKQTGQDITVTLSVKYRNYEEKNGEVRELIMEKWASMSGRKLTF